MELEKQKQMELEKLEKQKQIELDKQKQIELEKLEKQKQNENKIEGNKKEENKMSRIPTKEAIEDVVSNSSSFKLMENETINVVVHNIVEQNRQSIHSQNLAGYLSSIEDEKTSKLSLQQIDSSRKSDENQQTESTNEEVEKVLEQIATKETEIPKQKNPNPNENNQENQKKSK